MYTEVGTLLRDAANIFAQLAAKYEDDKKNNEARLAHIEATAHENREALQAAAELILEKLN